MKENPLVSIVVITYNSSKYVLDTLESIKAQTYQNIELIVSDDCSKDNTIEICEKWINKNKKHFIDTLIITSDHNTGVSANCNRGYKAAKGEWIKGIAGDDLLLPDCIQTNINYIQKHKTDILFSRTIPFTNDQSPIPYIPFNYNIFKLKNKDFLIALTIKNYLPAPSAFINRSFFNSIGGYEETIPLLEDWPFWIKSLYNHAIINFINCDTTLYRMHQGSLSSFNRNEKMEESIKLCADYRLKYQKKINFFLWVNGKINYLIIYKGKKYKILKWLKLFNPMSYYIKYIFSNIKK